MKLWRKSLCTLVILGLCAAVRPGVAASAKPSAHPDSAYTDVNLEQAAIKALRRNPALGLVDASAWHGTITLTGTVDHYQDRADAEAAVRELAGVRNLQSAITVTTTPVDDFELQKRLEDRLRFARADMGVTFPQVRVEVHDGMVVLSGAVKDSIERATALALAGSTDGVISVREELSISPDLLTNDDVRTEVNKVIYHSTDAISSTPVHATFRDGTVTLMGAVATPKEKEAMVSRLRDIYGVVTVEDELVVRNPRPALNEAALTQPASSCLKH
jgi:osmotically-inducible protein OsmY